MRALARPVGNDGHETINNQRLHAAHTGPARGTTNMKMQSTHPFRKLPSNLLGDPAADLSHALPNGFERAALAILHKHLDLAAARADIRAIEMYDIDVRGAGRDLDLAQQLLHRGPERGDRLARHHFPSPQVAHCVYCAPCPLPKPGELLELIVRPLVKFVARLLDRLLQTLHGRRWRGLTGRNGEIGPNGWLARVATVDLRCWGCLRQGTARPYIKSAIDMAKVDLGQCGLFAGR